MLHFQGPARGVPELTRDDPTAFAPPPTFGPFRVLHQIGVGALGPVFRTYEPSRDRLVAVKVFRLDIPPEQAQTLATHLAAAAEAGLFHPAIVEPIAAGVEGTVAYRAEEYVASESLDVAMREHTASTLSGVVAIVAQLAAAIDIARAAGVGHGALHPRDIFLGADDVRVSGFGIVGALEATGIRAPVRRPYSAPERVAGREWATPADVFSLAAITFELMTGRRPSGTGADFGTFDDSPFAGIPGLAEIFAQAMHEEPRRRFITATTFSDAIARLDAIGRGVTFTPPAVAASTLLDGADEALAFPDEDALAGEPARVAEPPKAATAPVPGRSVRPPRRRVPSPAPDLVEEAAVAGPPLDPLPATPGPDALAAAPVIVPGLGAPFGGTTPVVADASPDERMVAVPPAADVRDRDDLALEAAEMALSDAAPREPAVRASEQDEPEEDEDIEAPPDSEPAERWAPAAEPEPPPPPRDEPSADPAEPDEDEPDMRPSYGREAVGLGLSDLSSVRRDRERPLLSLDDADATGAASSPVRPALSAGSDAGEPTAPRRPYRRLEEDEIVNAETSVSERSRPAMLPLAMMLTLGLLVGFAAGFTIGERGAVAQSTAGSDAVSAAAPVPAAGAPDEAAPTSSPAPDRTVAPPPAAAPTRGAATARTGRLVVRSSPSGAAVTIDGRWRGRTPLTLPSLSLGSHAVRVVLPGYEVATEDVTLSSAANARTLSFALTRQPAAAARSASSAAAPAAARGTGPGILEIDSRPTGARVFVDGAARGTTPVRLTDLGAGAHSIRLELADHQPWTSTARVVSGTTVRVGGSLEPIR